MPKMCPGGDTAPAKHERSRKTSWSTEAFLLVVIIAGWTSCVPAVASDPTEILKASIPKEFRGHVLAEIKVSPEGLLLAGQGVDGEPPAGHGQVEQRVDRVGSFVEEHEPVFG